MDQVQQRQVYDNAAMVSDENDGRACADSETSIVDENPTLSVIRRKIGEIQSTVGWNSSSSERPVELLRVTVVQDIPTAESSQVDETITHSLEAFLNKRQGKDIARHRSKKVRRFYKRQDELINAFQYFSRPEVFENTSEDTASENRKQATLYSKITFSVNLVLLMAKLAASILSGSMSIISSLVDSVVDLLSGVILWWASRAMKKRNPYDYPQGRSKLEPVSIVVLSVVMSLASLQLIRESGEKIMTLVDDHTSLPDMELPTFIIAGSTVVFKLILWMVCRRISSPTVQALAQDHRNDVMSNTVAIVCGYLGSQNFQNATHLTGFVYLDPIGAILISLYIIYNWYKTGSEQVKILTGYTATPDFLSQLTWIVMNHDPRISHIDTLRAYHYGNNFIVKVDIVLPESMSLRKAHDIGESLQQKLERLPEVERAFVHLDYDFLHKPSSEHKVI